MKIFSIDGYFTDDNVKFSNQLVTSNEEPIPYWTNYKEDDMFFKGLDCESLKLPAMILGLFVVTSFKFIEEADLTNSTLITAEYFSCDNKTSFLIIETSKENFIFQNVPLETWEKFKKAESKDIFYFSQIKNYYPLNIN